MITDKFRIMASRKDACIKGGIFARLNMKQRKGKIMLVMRNGLVTPHSVSPHILCVKKITSFINGKATKP